MLLALMYHHINSDKFSNSKDVFEKHLEYIVRKFNVVLPGDRLCSSKINVCLVFDDAYYDFYYFVLPLLKEYNAKAVLSVPVKYILEDTKLPSDKRLRIKHSDMMKDDNFVTHAPFCTWKEIKQMSDSALVRVASHSYSHCSLFDSDINFEIGYSKRVISDKISKETAIFVYQYGDMNPRIVKSVQKYYRYSFGIGAIDNKNWYGVGEVIYRLYADDLNDPISLFSKKNLLKYRLNFYKLRIKKWLRR